MGQFSRRDFLGHLRRLTVGAAAANSLGLAGLLSASNAVASDGYKALVFIFLNGGNDSFNMIAPKGAGDLRQRYEDGRAVVALSADSLHALNLMSPAKIYGGESYNDFGMHPACGDLATMFNDGELSAICNVGNLVQPTSREQYNQLSVPLPPKLFSHSDQQRQFHSEPINTFNHGWGGKIAELLSAHNPSLDSSPLMSVSGLNPFQVVSGGSINTYVMKSTGAAQLRDFRDERQLMVEAYMAANDDSLHLMSQKYQQVFASAQNAQDIVLGAFDIADGLGVDYDGLFTAAGATGEFGEGLKSIAKMIGGRASSINERPIFFISLGGFDAHQNLLPDHHTSMTELNAGLKAFRDVLTAQGDFDKVLSFVGSEFGRTFTPNGTDSSTAGTDHAWGGHALVMGDMVNGGTLFGTHPDLKLNQGLDSSNRGLWIPTTAMSQCTAVMAGWFGVPTENIPEISSTLANFDSPFEPGANLQFIKPEVV